MLFRSPLGPLIDVNIGGNSIFGFQAGLTFDAFDLFGIAPRTGSRWTIDTDYLSKRGPALGTKLDYKGKDLFDIPSEYIGQFRAYGIHDDGIDILGGGRGENDDHPVWRGRLLWRQDWWHLPGDYSLQTEFAVLSDKNFLEQFFKKEFDTGLNQETVAYLKRQRDNWAWTALVEPRLRTWVTETEWLPRADAWLLGQSLLSHWLTYNAHVDVGYAQLRPTNEPPPPVEIGRASCRERV